MEDPLPTNCRPLNLNHSSEEFSQEWRNCILDASSDLTCIIDMMEPAFLHWGKVFLKKEHEPDMLYTTLCKLLSSEKAKAEEKITLWLDWVDKNSTLEDEFKFIFIERVRKFKYIPEQATPIMVEFIVAKDFKYGIYHQIRSVTRLLKRDALFSANFENDFEISVFEEPADILLLKTIEINTNNWQSYLFSLLKRGYTSIKRSEFTKIHRKTLYNEETKLWEHLKLLL